MSPGTLPSWSRDKACGLTNPRPQSSGEMPGFPQHLSGAVILLQPLHFLCPLGTVRCAWVLSGFMTGRAFTSSLYANSPVQVKQPLYFSHLILGLGLDQIQTLGSLCFLYFCLLLFVCQGSWEFICLFLSAGQTQAPLRPLLTIGGDEVLLMMFESLDAASRTLSFWFCDLDQVFVSPKGLRVISCKLLCHRCF